MGIEDPQGKRSLEQSTTRPSENKQGRSSGNPPTEDKITAIQRQTREAIRKTLGK